MEQNEDERGQPSLGGQKVCMVVVVVVVCVCVCVCVCVDGRGGVPSSTSEREEPANERLNELERMRPRGLSCGRQQLRFRSFCLFLCSFLFRNAAAKHSAGGLRTDVAKAGAGRGHPPTRESPSLESLPSCVEGSVSRGRTQTEPTQQIIKQTNTFCRAEHLVDLLPQDLVRLQLNSPRTSAACCK